MRIAPLVLLAAAVATPVSAQSFLGKLIGKSSSSQTSALQASIAPAQSAAIDRALAAPIDDPKIAADRTDAASLIRALLVTGACNRDGRAWQTFNERSLRPHTYLWNEDTTINDMQYHDKGTCLDVVRLGDWEKPALNVLSFQAYYVAPDSGEASRQGFDLQKGSDGQWLVRQIGTTFR